MDNGFEIDNFSDITLWVLPFGGCSFSNLQIASFSACIALFKWVNILRHQSYFPILVSVQVRCVRRVHGAKMLGSKCQTVRYRIPLSGHFLVWWNAIWLHTSTVYSITKCLIIQWNKLILEANFRPALYKHVISNYVYRNFRLITPRSSVTCQFLNHIVSECLFSFHDFNYLNPFSKCWKRKGQ